MTGKSWQAQTVQGKNLFDPAKHTLSSGYYYDGSGLPTPANSGYVRISQINCNPNTAYTISCNLNFYSIWFFNGDTSISRIYTTFPQRAFTTPENCNRIRISMVNTSGSADTVAFEWLQLELGSTATTYEAIRPKLPQPRLPPARLSTAAASSTYPASIRLRCPRSGKAMCGMCGRES